MEKKNSELHRYQQESELKRKKKVTTTIVFLSQLDLFLLEKNRHFVTCT